MSESNITRVIDYTSYSPILITQKYISETSHQENDYSASFRKAGSIRAAFAIITILIGSFGNSLTFILMKKKPMKNTSSGIYFGYLAITDTLTVYFGQLLFLVGFFNGIDLIGIHSWSCR